MPVMSAICVGCMVMLLVNKVVDEGLYNGSVGIVRDICYRPGEEVGSKGARMYVVVKFEKVNCPVHLCQEKQTRNLFRLHYQRRCATEGAVRSKQSHYVFVTV